MGKKIFWIIAIIIFFTLPFKMAFSNESLLSLGDIQGEEVLAQQSLQASLVGLWRAQIQSGQGNCVWEIIFQRNGGFSKTFRCGQMMTYELGTYSVGQGFIRLIYTSHQPTEYKGRKLHYPGTETIFFQFVDRNHIYCEDRILGGKWHAYRVR